MLFCFGFFFLYSVRGGPVRLANKVTRRLGRIGRGNEPPLPRQAGQGEGPGGLSAPWTAAGRVSPSAPWTASGGGRDQHPGQRRCAALRGRLPSGRRLRSGAALARPSAPPVPPPPPLQWCWGPEDQASSTEISLQRDLAPDIRLARGGDAGGVGLPSGWWE